MSATYIITRKVNYQVLTLYLLIGTLIPSWGPTSMISSKLNYLPKSSSPNAITLELQLMDFGWIQTFRRNSNLIANSHLQIYIFFLALPPLPGKFQDFQSLFGSFIFQCKEFNECICACLSVCFLFYYSWHQIVPVG